MPPHRPREFSMPGGLSFPGTTMPFLPPMPPIRPADLPMVTAYAPADPAEEPVPEAAAPPLAPPAPGAGACRAALDSGRLVAVSVPSVIGVGGCGIAAPLRLQGIILADGRKVSVEPAALMRCSLASALADWVREDLAPLVEKSGAKLDRIEDADSYDCRGRNRVAGAKLSEHGKGDAFDIRALVAHGGAGFAATDRGPAGVSLRQAIKESACTRFMTVLGPGSDGYHESHIHVDLEERRNGSHYCRWETR
jgi:hypothetical protein